ncbi:DUF572-domain-containing protein [Polyplosphaeria fusca]|uniref:DUF572-domain-containing protein n=1 Tax=Polyplosphaeria fusca TaxID=682080 RepID=A0A9P4QPP7_9PLEO|nr:DUF572-domain-containing protein [Polyplosphaeria fusca]
MQGFNMGRYYPPDEHRPPTFNTTSHPLGSRARHLASGILTVRFELPFAVWCTTCKPESLVGQGVRFNAQKRRVGMYYSTPIWGFRMKHTECGGWWEIWTDPENAEYKVVEGGRRRDYGGDKDDGGDGVLSEGERERRREDAFAGLEGRREEERGKRERGRRVEELLERAEVWRDGYERNREMRKRFRGERKVIEGERREVEGLQEKLSFGFEVLGEVEGDRVMAGMVEFGRGREDGGEAMRKSLFEKRGERGVGRGGAKKKLKAEVAGEKSRRNLQEALVGNTRVAMDPFLAEGSRTSKASAGLIPGLKRKREDGPATSRGSEEDTTRDSDEKKPASIGALVDYDSD